jgi:hypothetical protein
MNSVAAGWTCAPSLPIAIMSQSDPESPLRAVIANIVTPAHTERERPYLAELADHAFALVDVQAGGDLNNVPSDICTKRQARILYSMKSKGGLPLPIKVILYQDVPAGQIQRVVVNFQTETVQCEGKPSLPIETSRIKLAQKEIKPYLQKSLKILQEIWGEISDEVRHSACQVRWCFFFCVPPSPSDGPNESMAELFGTSHIERGFFLTSLCRF